LFTIPPDAEAGAFDDDGGDDDGGDDDGGGDGGGDDDDAGGDDIEMEGDYLDLDQDPYINERRRVWGGRKMSLVKGLRRYGMLAGGATEKGAYSLMPLLDIADVVIAMVSRRPPGSKCSTRSAS
jgi:hypothetical protein